MVVPFQRGTEAVNTGPWRRNVLGCVTEPFLAHYWGSSAAGDIEFYTLTRSRSGQFIAVLPLIYVRLVVWKFLLMIYMVRFINVVSRHTIFETPVIFLLSIYYITFLR